MIRKFHHYFLLTPSPWPLIISFSCFNLFFSGLLIFKFLETWIFIFNLICLVLISFFWWIDYSKEFNLEGFNSSGLEKGVKMAIILFISSEVLFFFSFFWSYFHFTLSPTIEARLHWPPIDIESFDYTNTPIVGTLVLLTSRITMTLAHHFIAKGDTQLCRINLLLTVVLGAFFTYLQASEYASAFFGIRDSTFGTVFFVLTGFHGLHVIIGTIFIRVSLTRRLSTSSRKNCCSSIELASWYWHFVDVVWLFLYFLIYYLNS